MTFTLKKDVGQVKNVAKMLENVGGCLAAAVYFALLLYLLKYGTEILKGALLSASLEAAKVNFDKGQVVRCYFPQHCQLPLVRHGSNHSSQTITST